MTTEAEARKHWTFRLALILAGLYALTMIATFALDFVPNPEGKFYILTGGGLITFVGILILMSQAPRVDR